MKKLSLYLFCIFCVTNLISFSQTKAVPATQGDNTTSTKDSFLLEMVIPGNFIYMEVDVLNNLYLVTRSNQLKKINPRGDSMAVYNDVKQYGNPSLIDVSNPLKVLLYYKNFATVVMLDRMLSQRNSINFRQQNIFSVKAIATSYDNNIWLFDEQDLILKKINEQGTVMTETSDWRLIMDDVPSPSLIIDNNDFVYLYDPNKGFYIFDYYGTYKNNLPLLHWENVSVNGKRLMGFSGKQYFSYELQTLTLKTYTLSSFFKDYISIKAMNSKIYLLKKDRVEIYSVL